jgi:hypothetical protein
VIQIPKETTANFARRLPKNGLVRYFDRFATEDQKTKLDKPREMESI